MLTIERTMQAGFGNSNQKSKGPRPGVLEQHHGNVATAMSGLRDLGHTVTSVEHSTKSPVGYAKSTIFHKSGGNKFKTHVRTKFNAEGGDHEKKVVTEADNGDNKDKDRKSTRLNS